VQRALLVKDLPLRSAALLAPEAQCRPGGPYAQVAHDELGNPRGQCGIEHQCAERANGNQAEHRLHRERKGGGVPQLRCVRARVRARHRPITTRVAADAFGYSELRIELRKLEERLRQIEGARVEPIAAQSEDRRRLLDRPDRAAMVAQRVVEGVLSR
jgi:hypothetical protein